MPLSRGGWSVTLGVKVVRQGEEGETLRVRRTSTRERVLANNHRREYIRAGSLVGEKGHGTTVRETMCPIRR